MACGAVAREEASVKGGLQYAGEQYARSLSPDHNYHTVACGVRGSLLQKSSLCNVRVKLYVSAHTWCVLHVTLERFDAICNTIPKDPAQTAVGITNSACRILTGSLAEYSID